jgi:hypothetical protein
MSMTNEQIQALKAAESIAEQLPAALDAWEKSNQGSVTLGWIHAANPIAVQFLLAERDADKALIANLTAERDALREGAMGDARHSNTRAAADIYFQLAEECQIPPGGSLVQHIDMMRDRIAELEDARSTLSCRTAFLALPRRK